MPDELQAQRISQQSPGFPYPSHDAARLRPALRQTALIATLIETLAGWEEERLLTRHLESGPEALSRALDALPLGRRSELAKKVDSTLLAELQSLAGEPDSNLFLEGILGLSRRLLNDGQARTASFVIAVVLRAAETEPGFHDAASSRLLARLRLEGEVAEGRGSFGARAEFLARHFVREASHPATIAGFAAGAAAFQCARLFVLSRLAAAPASLATRAWGARALASAAGMGAETFSLTLSARSLRHALGENQSWDFRSLRRELLATGITLGLMRGAGAVAESGFLRFHGILPGTIQPARFSGFTEVSRVLFPQTAMFGALLVANRTEVALGLRPDSGASLMLTDSLATLLQFHVGGRIFHSLQPGGFRNWVSAMELQSRGLSPRSGSASGPRIFPDLHSQMLLASSGRGPILRDSRGRLEGVWMMSELPKAQPSVVARPESVLAPTPVRFRDVLESSPHPVLVVDSLGEIRYANDQARRIFQSSLLDFDTQHIMEIFEPHPSEPQIYRWIRAENDLTFWRMDSRILGGEEGLVAHFLTDITELQRLKDQVAELHEHNTRLEAKAQLADRYLHDGGNLLSDLSFREGMLERLVGTDNSSGEPSRLSVVAGKVRELGSSIGRVMDFYRTWRRVTGGAPRQVSVLSMEPMLTEALMLNEGARENNGIQLATDFGREALTIRGEEPMLINAVLNLLVNACHAMPRGGTLRVRSYPQDAWVVIEIADTGVGIPPENLPHIFDPGFTTRRDSGGTGLGLAGVREAIETLHEGRVEVESQVGEGTTFRVFLRSSSM